jgi:hypothetical protein
MTLGLSPVPKPSGEMQNNESCLFDRISDIPPIFAIAGAHVIYCAVLSRVFYRPQARTCSRWWGCGIGTAADWFTSWHRGRLEGEDLPRRHTEFAFGIAVRADEAAAPDGVESPDVHDGTRDVLVAEAIVALTHEDGARIEISI